MNINEYMKLIKEIKDKKGYQWDEKLAMFALHKYLMTPAVRDFYSNIELQRSDDKGRPIFCDMNGRIVLGIGVFDDNFGEPTFKMTSHGSMPSTSKVKSYLTNTTFDRLTQLYNELDKAESFADFSKTYTHHVENYRRLSQESKQFLKMAYIAKDYTGEIDDSFQSILYQEMFETVDKFYGDPLRTGGYLASALVLISKGLNDQNKEEYEKAVTRLMKYDKINIDNYSYEQADFEHRLKFAINLSKQEHYKNNTLLGSALNNLDNIFNSVMDNLVFEDAKSAMLFELKMVLKEQTLEQMLESDPIIDEIYQEAIRRSPSLLQTFNERFKHTQFVDADRTNDEQGAINVVSHLDNICLYGDKETETILDQQFKYGRLANGTEFISPNSSVERFVGHDGYSPYYIVTANQAPLTMEVDSTIFSGFLISRKIDNDKLAQLFENMFLDCMKKNRPLVIEDGAFMSRMEGEKAEIFNNIKAKFKGLVVTAIMPEDMPKYRALLNSELTYADILRLDSTFDEMTAKRLSQSDFEDFIESESNLNKPTSKSSLKL